MNIEEHRLFCLSKKAVIESFPFDNEVFVFKVLDKLFQLANINLSMSLKCEKEVAIEL